MIKETRSRLGELGALAAKTETSERRILEQAKQRLAEVNAAIGRHSTGVESAPDAAQDRYLNLVNERGQLNLVIARAKEALGVR